MAESKQKLFVGIAATVILVIGIVVVYRIRHVEAAEPREKYPKAVHVVAMKPPPGKTRTTTQPATIEAFYFVKLYARVTGELEIQKVDKQEVDIESRVKKGDLLAVIVAPELIKERDQAAAEWERAKAQKTLAEKQVKAVKADVEATKKLVVRREAEMRSAKAYLKFCKARFKRYTELSESNAIEGAVVDEEADRFEAAEFRRDGAIAAVYAAEYDVEAKSANLEKAEADVNAAEAHVNVAKAILDKADVYVGFTKIIADFDGVITERNYNSGAFIRTADRGGQLPLFVLKGEHRMRVIVQVPDMDVRYVSRGDPAELVISTVHLKTFKGFISRTAKSEDQQSRTMRVEVDLDNKDGLLQDGMYGEITIRMSKAPRPVFSLPSPCLHADSKGARYVFVVKKNIVHRKAVSVGFDDGRNAGIMSGLNADDLVVVEDNGSIGEGSVVEAEIADTPRETPAT